MGSSGRARRSYTQVDSLMAAPYVCTISIILLALAVCCPPPSCLAAELMTWKCDNGTSYAANTTYQSNVRSLLASLAANASRSSPVGFATAILGAGTDMVWGLGLCRGDTNGTDCGSCLSLVQDVAFGRCQGVKDVSVFYDRCILRYSYRDFLTNPDNTQVQVSEPSKENVTSGAERFNALVAFLVGALSDLAAFNTTTRYAVGLVTSDKGFPATTYDVVYSINGMVQCTPDKAPRACRGCLQALMDVMQALMDVMPASFNGSIGGQINAVWCNLRYEVFQFYDGSPMVRLVAPPWIPPSSTDQGTYGLPTCSALPTIVYIRGHIVCGWVSTAGDLFSGDTWGLPSQPPNHAL